MLRKIVHWVISLSPNIRKRVLKNWYELLNHYLYKQNYPFLNYGYCDNNPPIELFFSPFTPVKWWELCIFHREKILCICNRIRPGCSKSK
jgi:hypothetical protein